MTTTEQGRAGGFRLTVLNPGGRDPAQDFSLGAGTPGERGHAPVNFHGYAACTGGVFHRDVRGAIAERLPVLLLLRGDFRETQRAFAELKKSGLTVAISLKETGLHQIAAQLSNPAKLARFREIIGEADGCLGATPAAAELYATIARSSEMVRFIPTPYPLDEASWDFSIPIEARAGILIGTREWDVPSRNHLTALLAAAKISRETGEPVTVFDFAGRRGARLLAALDFPPGKLRVIDRRLTYPNYLREVARHKIVFQLDRSAVPGQVAGDATLCRLPCLGGDGAIDRLVSPAGDAGADSASAISQLAIRLLTDPAACEEATRAIAKRAAARISFPAIRRELQDFYDSLAKQSDR